MAQGHLRLRKLRCPFAIQLHSSTSGTSYRTGKGSSCNPYDQSAPSVTSQYVPAQQVVLARLDGGTGGGELIQGVDGQHRAQGSGLEGRLILLLGLLVMTMIGVITAGLLLPVHTGGCSHVVSTPPCIVPNNTTFRRTMHR